MATTILSIDDLRRSTGYSRPTDVARCLKAQGVKVFWGKDGPWTTSTALDAALGLRPPTDAANEPYPADIL